MKDKFTHKHAIPKRHRADFHRLVFILAVLVVLAVISAMGRAQETDPQLREVLGGIAELNVQLMEIEGWCHKFASHPDPNMLPIARARIIANMDMDMWDADRNRCRTYDEMFDILFTRILKEAQK